LPAIKPSQILILDEATSSIDTRTELMIQKGLDNIMASKTSFVIAHRLSTVRDAEMILVLEQGRIIEAGSHTTLMAEKGRYYDMHVAQYPHLS
jgi:ATP-binding cassette subfamily B multidrug efflux pump